MAEIHSMRTDEGTGVRYIDSSEDVGQRAESYFAVRIGPLTLAEALLATEVKTITDSTVAEVSQPITQEPPIIGGRRVENARSVDEYSGPAALALKSAGVTN